MAKKKGGFVAAIDSLPWIAKFLLCLPVLNIVYGIYRIVKGCQKGNGLMILVGILWIIPFAEITWLIDLICTIIWGRPRLCA